MEKALVVLSGGQDSTTCLFWAKHVLMNEIHAITFDYNQRHRREVNAAQRVAKLAGCRSHEVIHIPDVILKSTSPLNNYNFAVEKYESADVLPGGLEKTFVPMRNALFLTIAANRAYSLGARKIVTGVSQEDYGGYPDCRDTFIAAQEAAITYGLDMSMKVLTPLINLDKKRTVQLAQSLPGCIEAMKYTHTCYNGTKEPCGKCHACLLREKGFIEAGLVDPLYLD